MVNAETEILNLKIVDSAGDGGFHAISCTDLKVLDVPPVEYHVVDIIQKGLNMFEGDSEVGKTNFGLGIAIEMTTGSSTFLDRFAITQCRVLYCDLEMGISALKQRIGLLLAGLGKEWPESLQVISPGTDEGFEFDLKSEQTQKNIEREIARVKPDVLFLDTLFDSSSYDLISAKESLELKKYLKKIRSQFNLSVVLIHHRRKPSGDNRFPSAGKHEIWGSVSIPAACDRIVSLAGTSNEISVVCSKARNGVKFGSFIMKLCADKPKDAGRLWFQYVGEYKERGSKEKTDEQVIQVFESFGKDRVSRADLVSRSKELKCYGWDTLKGRLEATKHYIAVKEGKETFIVRCEDVEIIDEKE